MLTCRRDLSVASETIEQTEASLEQVFEVFTNKKKMAKMQVR